MVYSFFGRVCLGLRFFGTENEGVPRSSIEALRIWIERWTAKRFVVLTQPETTGESKGNVHVTMLLNFFDELKRRLP